MEEKCDATLFHPAVSEIVLTEVLHALSDPVRLSVVAQLMGAPDPLVYKVPTADLELLKPLKPDEDAFGVTYEQIDDFLEGKDVPPEVFDIIVETWRRSAHKRALPVAP